MGLKDISLRGVVGLIAASGLAFLATAQASVAQYPERPITMIVPWSPGGGASMVGTVIANLLYEELGQPVNIVNIPGGFSSVGHTAISNATPDGYTLGMITNEVSLLHHQGLMTVGPRDFTALGLPNLDSTSIVVQADAKWNTTIELLDDVKASPPGTYSMAGPGPGSGFTLGLQGLLRDYGIELGSVKNIPMTGGSTMLLELAAGGVDFVISTLAESRALRESGKVRALGVLGPQNPSFPEVPSDEVLQTVITWRGVAGPKGLDPAARDILIPALEKIFNDEKFQSFMVEQGFGTVQMMGEDFAQFMDEQSEYYSGLLGVANNSTE